MDLFCTDPAQPLTAAGEELDHLDHLDHDLSSLGVVHIVHRLSTIYRRNTDAIKTTTYLRRKRFQLQMYVWYDLVYHRLQEGLFSSSDDALTLPLIRAFIHPVIHSLVRMLLCGGGSYLMPRRLQKDFETLVSRT